MPGDLKDNARPMEFINMNKDYWVNCWRDK